MAIEYDVVAHHEIKGPMMQQVGQMASAWDQVKANVLAISAYIGGRAIVDGMESMLQSVVGINAEMENYRLGTAAILYANVKGVKNYEEAIVHASGLMEDLKKASITSAATPEEFIEFGNTVAMGVAASHHGMVEMKQGVIEMTNLGVAAAQALNIPQWHAAYDLTRLMTGQAGAHVRMWRFLQQQVGMTAEEFNKLTSEQRYKVLENALSKYGEAQKYYARGWAGLRSTVRGYIDEIRERVGEPIFERMNKALAAIVDYTHAHEKQILSMANSIGDKLALAYDRAKESAKWMWEHKADIERTVAISAIGYTLSPLAGAGLRGALASKAMSSGAMASTAASVSPAVSRTAIEEVRAMFHGGGAIGPKTGWESGAAITGVGPLTRAAGEPGMMMVAMAGLQKAIGSEFIQAISRATIIIGPWVLAIGAIVGSIVGAVENSQWARDQLKIAWDNVADTFSGLVLTMKDLAGIITSGPVSTGEILILTLRDITETLKPLIIAIRTIALTFGDLAMGIKIIIGLFDTIITMAEDIAHGDFSKAGDDFMQFGKDVQGFVDRSNAAWADLDAYSQGGERFKPTTYSEEHNKGLFDAMWNEMFPQRTMHEGMPIEKMATQKAPHVKIDKVEIKIQEAEHPERWAPVIKKTLEGMSRFALVNPAEAHG